MTCYSIPSMSMENEFRDLGFVAKYVDHLLSVTDDPDYATVYEWSDDGPGPYSPLAILTRVENGWCRRVVLTSEKVSKSYGKCTWFLGEPTHVNDH